MDKVLDKAKNSILRQKKMYVFLIALTILGILAGILFITVLSKTDQNLVTTQLTNFFGQIKTGKINYTNGIVNSISSNLLYGVGIWLLGISVIGLPFILFLLFMKGFITGFSIASIISLYHMKGVPLAFTYIFPHHIIGLFISILLSFYAVNFCIKLFSYLFLKKEINFKEAMRRYVKILALSLAGLVITSIIEIYLAPFFMKFFTNFIK